jgi:hypothetical protein
VERLMSGETVSLILNHLVQGTILVAALAAGVTWLRRWLRAQVVKPLDAVHREIATNDGKSLADAVHRIESQVGVLTARFTDHLIYHEKERRE